MWNVNAEFIDTKISSGDIDCDVRIRCGSEGIVLWMGEYGQVTARLVGNEVYVSVAQLKNGEPIVPFAPIILQNID
jgi:hypothetical protein